MAVVVPAQGPGAAAAAGSKPRAAASARGLSRPEGMSPAAQALAPKKASGFLQLFRRIAAGRKAPNAGAPSGQAAPAKSPGNGGRAVETPEAPRRKAPGASAGERRAAAAKAPRAARRGKAAGEAEESGPGEPATPPVSARRLPEAALPAPSSAAAEARRQPPPAQARVVVVDLRTPAAGVEQQEGRRLPSTEAARTGFERVLLAREGGTAAEPGAPAQRQAAAGSGQTSLPGQAPLQERLVPEIVHHAGIVLHDGGEGEIRLVLKPEHLGSVRIHLHLGESSLEGRIVVDNTNVKELLDANLEQLKNALRQEGYASANINVTVSGDGHRRREPEPETALPATAGHSAGSFERATPAMLDLGFTEVNLFA